MTYIENVFICMASTLLIAALCMGTRQRKIFLSCIAGMGVCLLSAYINTLLAALYGADTFAATVEIEMCIRDSRSDSLSQKEQGTLRDMRIVQEMYARGFEFLPLDIYRAKADRFQIIDGKLMPSLSSIDGLGGKAAEAVVEAVKRGERFLSLEDFWQKTKVPKTTIDLMAELGIFGDLPRSNQLSLFDLEFTG